MLHEEGSVEMVPEKTALILIGYQNDYYSTSGALHDFLEDSGYVRRTLENTITMLDRLKDTAVTMIETPIVFTEDYSELHEPVGILASIRDVQAFRVDTDGSAGVPELDPYRDRILQIPGKRGMNAFIGTRLEDELHNRRIEDLVILGSVVSVCIDSTGRSAVERGYRVHFASDCLTGRTLFEHDFYCQNIFPLYADVSSSTEIAERLLSASTC